MAKVIVTIAPDDGMCFEDIMSFNTENYIGIWDSVEEKFMLVRESSNYFEPWYISPKNDRYYGNLAELDEAVYEKCDEHIEEVFDNSRYTFVIN